MIAEMTIFLRQNFCIDEWTNCKDNVAVHFRPMHEMAMEKYGGKFEQDFKAIFKVHDSKRDLQQ